MAPLWTTRVDWRRWAVWANRPFAWRMNWTAPVSYTHLDVLAFVEVKLRTRGGTEAGEAAVTPLKRRRMAEAARCYLGAHPEHAGRCVRFDVVTVTAEGVRHVPDAFSGCEW